MVKTEADVVVIAAGMSGMCAAIGHGAAAIYEIYD